MEFNTQTMKRSIINNIILEADEFIKLNGYKLPPFAYFSPNEFVKYKTKCQNIFSTRLGWDITDYGENNFDELGLFLFTLRNGFMSDLKNGIGMCYAEKIMMSRQEQISPLHRHLFKTEDIINRGGANLAIQVFESDADGKIDRKAPVPIYRDGIAKTYKAGEIIQLTPGESVTLTPGNWHKFWGDGGDVLIGEVSTVNDDLSDNIFEDPIGRFSKIEEDTDPLHLLVSDYENWDLL